jgi:putative transposase
MNKFNSTYHAQFITATILEWKHLLKDDSFKDIIISSLQFLHKERSVIIYAFVIMPNHMHMIWQIQDGYVQDKIQQRFLKFTAQQMKFKMVDENNKMLMNF